MPRAIWKGSISFGLVNIPVKLYSATKEKSVKFHLLCPYCKTPLRNKRFCPKCEKEISWEEVIKGYKLGDKYIPLEKEELDKIKLKTLKIIEVLEFVDAGQIDPLFVKKNYYLAPAEGGEKAFSLFREVLEITGKIAIGRVVLRGKEYVIAIRPYRKGLVLSVLYYKDEIVPIEQLEELKKLVVVKEQELALARALIEKMLGEFSLEKYKDRYREEVEKLVEKKLKGEKLEEEEKEEEQAKGDVIEQLKATLKALETKKVKKEA